MDHNHHHHHHTHNHSHHPHPHPHPHPHQRPHDARPPLPLAAAAAAPPPHSSASSLQPLSTAAAPPPYAQSPVAPNGYQTAAAETAQAALSEQATATPTPVPATNGRKRKASGVPGSRGVANLTPEQLAKKRANDREAQRAIRERTRNTIEGLEGRIRELESQQPFQELQRVAQERDRALAECEALKERLKAVAGIVGATHPGLHDIANLTASKPSIPPQAQQQQPTSHPSPQQYPSSHQHQQQQHHVYHDHHLHPDLRSPRESQPRSQSTGPSQPTSAADSPHETSSTAPRTYSTAIDVGSANQERRPDPFSHEQRRAPTAQMQQASSGERLGLNFLLDSNRHSQRKATSPLSNPLPYGPPSSHLQDKPAYLKTPCIGPATCPLDSLLGDFLFARRVKLKEGVPADQVLGPAYPDFCALADQNQNPERFRDCHPLSKLLIDILSKFPDLSQPPEKVAIIYAMFLTMRWLICPCQACFDRLPVYLHPSKEQQEVPHGTWIDHLPWPTQRSKLTLAKTPGTAIRFEDFFVPFTTTLSVNWGYDRGDVLVPSGNDSGMGQDFLLNPEFEVHLKTMSNWSVGPQFSNAFPELMDENIRIEDRG
ncbi:hypothetical protein MBLNU230_g4366t1 [Neophaeotheca triangularis]